MRPSTRTDGQGGRARAPLFNENIQLMTIPHTLTLSITARQLNQRFVVSVRRFNMHDMAGRHLCDLTCESNIDFTSLVMHVQEPR